MSEQSPAGWFPDPSGRHELRYWDGSAWTEHVADNGKQKTEALPSEPNVPKLSRSGDRIRKQIAKTGGPTGFEGGGTLFTEPLLVVNQKTKLVELTNEYSVFDQHGQQIGAVRQVGQSAAKKVLRAVSSLDQFMTHKLQVVDMAGAVQMSLVRPRKFMKSRVDVTGPSGATIGSIVQENMIGKIRFDFDVDGQSVGSLRAQNWRAWNFQMFDASGEEVATITKTFEGVARTMFTTADNYVVKIHRPLEDPLRSLVVASALSVDTALKQDSRGFG